MYMGCHVLYCNRLQNIPSCKMNNTFTNIWDGGGVNALLGMCTLKHWFANHDIAQNIYQKSLNFNFGHVSFHLMTQAFLSDKKIIW